MQQRRLELRSVHVAYSNVVAYTINWHQVKYQLDLCDES